MRCTIDSITSRRWSRFWTRCRYLTVLLRNSAYDARSQRSFALDTGSSGSPAVGEAILISRHSAGAVNEDDQQTGYDGNRCGERFASVDGSARRSACSPFFLVFHLADRRCEQILLDMLIEELHNHLYLKSFYCDVRWKPYSKGQTKRTLATAPHDSLLILCDNSAARRLWRRFGRRRPYRSPRHDIQINRSIHCSSTTTIKAATLPQLAFTPTIAQSNIRRTNRRRLRQHDRNNRL